MSNFMSSIVAALDNFTVSQIGENGTREYAWSNSFKERIVQLSFQLTRTKDEQQINNLANFYKQLLIETQGKYNSKLISRDEYLEYMSIFYRLIAHTRDIVDGKGEYTLSYMLLNVWAENSNQELSEYIFKEFVLSDDPSVHPFGSWKDIKGFYKFNPSSPLISYAIKLVNEQLYNDITSEKLSLVAKWIPREKSAQGALFNALATDYFSIYINTAQTEEARKRAILKAKTDYRKLISSLNKKLDTVQIKQCANTWSEIKPENQTSVTMHKQKKAFLNLKKDGKTERVDNDDRRSCAKTFTEFAEKAAKGEVEVKGKRLGLDAMVQDALNSSRLSQAEKDILNAQWLNNSLQTGALGKMIAMVDVSGSMSGDPMNAAIGLGLRIAEKSMLGKRVLTFSASPKWVNLDGVDKFIDMVSIVQRADWGMNTNFAAALNMILEAIIQNKLAAEDVEDMVLVILSDMQMDQADSNSKSLMETIEKSYADAGVRVCGKPYKAPHILFWNLRSTSGFPTLSTQKNASMMSGFSPALLNLFCEEGIDTLQSCTPWSLFIKSLDNDRYKNLDNKLREVLC